MRALAVRRAALALALLALSCAGREDAAVKPPILVEAEVDRTEARIGDLVTYRLKADHVASLSVRFPAVASGIGGFDVVETGSERREEGGRVVEERWYRLRTFDTGRHEIPEATVRYGEGAAESEAKAAAIAVEVRSVLPESEEASVELRDVKPPLALPPDRPWWALGAAVATLLVGLGAALWIHRSRKAAAAAPAKPAAPPLPAHEIALRALQALRARDLPGKGELDGYTVELTGIVRRYIEARFRVSAPEMTTDEFLLEASRGRLLEPGPADLVGDVLRRSDLIKFAAYRPTRFEADGLLSSAERFVEETKDLAAAFATEGVVA
jgi:hypothetical protein